MDCSNSISTIYHAVINASHTEHFHMSRYTDTRRPDVLLSIGVDCHFSISSLNRLNVHSHWAPRSKPALQHQKQALTVEPILKIYIASPLDARLRFANTY